MRNVGQGLFSACFLLFSSLQGISWRMVCSPQPNRVQGVRSTGGSQRAQFWHQQSTYVGFWKHWDGRGGGSTLNHNGQMLLSLLSIHNQHTCWDVIWNWWGRSRTFLQRLLHQIPAAFHMPTLTLGDITYGPRNLCFHAAFRCSDWGISQVNARSPAPNIITVLWNNKWKR